MRVGFELQPSAAFHFSFLPLNYGWLHSRYKMEQPLRSGFTLLCKELPVHQLVACHYLSRALCEQHWLRPIRMAFDKPGRLIDFSKIVIPRRHRLRRPSRKYFLDLCLKYLPGKSSFQGPFSPNRQYRGGLLLNVNAQRGGRTQWSRPAGECD